LNSEAFIEMNNSLVSILIPARNAERWLASAIESSIAQTWSRLEVIVVDDGSTDGTFKEAQRYSAPNVRVLHSAGHGASAARNTAFQASQGDFVQFLDADDILAKDKIEIQMRASVDGPPGLLTYGSIINFRHSPPPSTDARRPGQVESNLSCPLEFLIDLLGGNGRGGMVQTSQWLVPRTLALQAGNWNERLSVDDDGEYFCRVILAAQSIRYCPSSVTFYRQHHDGENLSSRISTSAAGAASQLESIRLKARWLHAVSSDARIDQATANSLNSLVIQSYPSAPKVSRDALIELKMLGRELEIRGGTSWFKLLRQIGGWKFARRIQCLANSIRRSASNNRA
jgi:glycosyltransferase involved in cell wall biosynthesis